MLTGKNVYTKITKLTKKDLDKIIDLEKSSWILQAQANVETILRRFELGHIMLGYEKKDKLVGMISFSYSRFFPRDFKSFPKTFKEFSSQAIPPDYNAIFVYNLEVRPSHRGKGYACQLVNATLEKSRRKGVAYCVIDGRSSSYNGSLNNKQEKVEPNPKFRKAINNYLQNMRFPSKEEFLLDPTLRFYYLCTKCKFLWILPNFLPEDTPSGGLRVILYKEILEEEK